MANSLTAIPRALAGRGEQIPEEHPGYALARGNGCHDTVTLFIHGNNLIYRPEKGRLPAVNSMAVAAETAGALLVMENISETSTQNTPA